MNMFWLVIVRSWHSKLVRSVVIGIVCFGVTFSPALAQDATLRVPDERARSYFGDEVLVDQDGKRHRFYSDLLANHVVLINVLFTGCKDSCPMQTQRLRQVRAQLGTRFGPNITFLSLSVDPTHDDSEALKRFAVKQQVDEVGWRFLTAAEPIMAKVLRRLGQWTDEPTDHGTLLIAGNAAKRHWVKLRPDAPVERIAADLIRLMEE